MAHRVLVNLTTGMEDPERVTVALLVATHDPSVAERFETRWSMENGSLRTKVLPCSA